MWEDWLQARVEAAGGQILFWNGVRVMGVLAVSRAIGDHCLRPFVIAQPEVTANITLFGDPWSSSVSCLQQSSAPCCSTPRARLYLTHTSFHPATYPILFLLCNLLPCH